jgi:4-hydroxybenzoate polyprenyltransferase
MLRALIKTMRPRQWTKNAFVLAAVVFDRQLTNPAALTNALIAFVLFCLLSSVVYIINDIADVKADRLHPLKRHRPIASGSLPVPVAIGAAVFLLIFTIPAAYLLSPTFAAIAVAYFAINIAYSNWLKHVPLVDVFIIAAGFVLRVAAGVSVVNVERFSPWLYVVTTLFALYIGFGKRRAELSTSSRRRRANPPRPGRVHDPLSRSTDHYCVGYDYRGLQPLHILRAQPSFQSRHDVHHSFCGLWYLPLPVFTSGKT